MNPQSAYSHRTDRLYERNENNVYEFEAVVLEAEDCGDGSFRVELDRTAFFPEGGGQYCDTGVISTDDGRKLTVSFVGISDGKIFHTISGALEKGATVYGSINKEKRLRRMQNHSGEHIISGLIHSLYGIENAGFHMTEGEINEITIDTSSPLDGDMLERVEVLANRAVLENRRIRAYYPDGDELKNTAYRSKTELSEEVRLVEIEGIDVCACCAPHVARTGEIGPIRIKGFMKYKKGVRITAVCGEDALDYFRALATAASDIARLYSTRPEDAYTAVLHREDHIKEKLAELHSLRERLLEYKLAEIAEAQSDRSKNICIFEPGCGAMLMRKLVNEGVRLTDGCFAVFSPDGDVTRYTVGSESHELSSLAAEMRSCLGGKGGGRGNMITGFCEASEEDIASFFDRLSL